ncbi:MAG: shikimate kinase [Cyanosarcina radialis HA8281-LM2]|jgi:shikimate kinase|nr:shikimate kinase [Cyanosarcina radialis HA8281-LM2]
MLKGINLYLVGMMGSGKTTVGQLLSQHLSYQFFDTDVLIEQVAKQSIKDIFANSGEDYFRQLESQVLAEISAYTHLTIATGGGIIERRENWSYLHHGLIVWLDVPLEILLSRLATDTTRPLKSELESRLEKRQPLYAQADLRITTAEGDTPEAIAARVIESIPQVLKSPAVPPSEGSN